MFKLKLKLKAGFNNWRTYQTHINRILLQLLISGVHCNYC